MTGPEPATVPGLDRACGRARGKARGQATGRWRKVERPRPLFIWALAMIAVTHWRRRGGESLDDDEAVSPTAAEFVLRSFEGTVKEGKTCGPGVR